MTDFQSFLEAINDKRILNLILHPNKLSSHIPSLYMQSLGKFNYIDKYFDKKRIPVDLLPIYKESLLHWIELIGKSFVEYDNPYIWNNTRIQIDGKSVFYKTFSDLNINRMADLCNNEGEFKWNYAKRIGLKDRDYLKWAGLIDAIPKEWKIFFKDMSLEMLQKIKKESNHFLFLAEQKRSFEKITTSQRGRKDWVMVSGGRM